MEIRGAGELLGDEQSGHISEIGFNLYMDMLTTAVKALRSGQKLDLDKPLHTGIEIDIGMSALIPENYIPNTYIRLQCYKRLSDIKTADELDDLQAEMIDRFGLLPLPLKTLIHISEIKLLAKPLGIKKIEMHHNGGIIEFDKNPHINPMNIIKLIQIQPDKYQLKGQEKLIFHLRSHEESRVNTLKSVLALLN